jgi:pSer/pThr/pTyr-binding forkhead associated (FHA) protein
MAGVVSGFLFHPISVATQPFAQALRGGDEIGISGRAVTSVLLGFAIGLFVSLARQVAKTAWLRLSLGRNEGKEWVVDAAQTFIGRSEAAHVPLFGDPNIAPMHACITRQGQHYWLQDGGTPGGTRLNGQPVQQAPLFHGAQIGVGGYVLEFLMRAGSAPARAAEQLGGQAYPVAPQMPAAQAPPAPALVALSGPIAGQRFPLLGPLEIGREASGIAIPFDATASRRHARVEPVGSGWQVVDLGSTNGTLVNGVKAGQVLLKTGDTFQVGATAFRIE